MKGVTLLGTLSFQVYCDTSISCVPLKKTTFFISATSIPDGDRSPVEEVAKPLKFESRFESGNLRRAIQVRREGHMKNINIQVFHVSL